MLFITIKLLRTNLLVLFPCTHFEITIINKQTRQSTLPKGVKSFVGWKHKQHKYILPDRDTHMIGLYKHLTRGGISFT